MSTEIIRRCDVCGAQNAKQIELDVIFTTEQTEGRSCKPYLKRNKIDICDECKDKILKGGVYIHAAGAQGYNKYFFKKMEK